MWFRDVKDRYRMMISFLLSLLKLTTASNLLYFWRFFSKSPLDILKYYNSRVKMIIIRLLLHKYALASKSMDDVLLGESKSALGIYDEIFYISWYLNVYHYRSMSLNKRAIFFLGRYKSALGIWWNILQHWCLKVYYYRSMFLNQCAMFF